MTVVDALLGTLLMVIVFAVAIALIYIVANGADE